MRISKKLVASIFLVIVAALVPAHSNGQAPSPSSGLTNQNIADMAKAGLSPEIIVAKIKSSPCNFDTSPAALKELKDSGVSENLILAMVEAPSVAKASSEAAVAEKSVAGFEPAHLHVYRPRRYAGSALAPSIDVDGKQIARVGNGRRCTIKLSPGPHSVGSDDKSSSISLDAKGGQEYFVRIDEETGFWKGHGKLTMLAPEQGSAEFKLQKPVEEDRKIAKELIEEESQTAQ